MKNLLTTEQIMEAYKYLTEMEEHFLAVYCDDYESAWEDCTRLTIQKYGYELYEVARDLYGDLEKARKSIKNAIENDCFDNQDWLPRFTRDMEINKILEKYDLSYEQVDSIL